MCMKLSLFYIYVGPVSSAPLCRVPVRVHTYTSKCKRRLKISAPLMGVRAAVVDCASTQGSTADQFHLIEHLQNPARLLANLHLASYQL